MKKKKAGLFLKFIIDKILVAEYWTLQFFEISVLDNEEEWNEYIIN
jgi:hypothetical protein